MSTTKPPQSSSPPPSLSAFLELANIYDQRNEPKMRDRFLILAADAANTAGRKQEAEQLLQRLLKASPHHMMKAYRTFAEAVQAEPVRVYIADLRQNYPPDVVRTLLESLRGKPAPVDAKTAADLPDIFPFQPEPESTSVLPSASSASTSRAAKVEDPPTEKDPPLPPLRPAPKKAAPKRQGASWLALVLFILVFLTGLALLGYALARPFLP
jgi:hypothetical protein